MSGIDLTTAARIAGWVPAALALVGVFVEPVEAVTVGGPGQHLVCGGTGGNTVAAGSTSFAGVGRVNATETQVEFGFPISGTIEGIFVQSSTVAGNPRTITNTLDLNGATTTSTCAISGNSATSCSDTAHTQSFTAGEPIDLKIVETTSANAAAITFCLGVISP